MPRDSENSCVKARKLHQTLASLRSLSHVEHDHGGWRRYVDNLRLSDAALRVIQVNVRERASVNIGP